MDDWHDIQVTYKLSNDDMYDAFNRPFLEDAVANGKPVHFIHDPEDFLDAKSLQEEWKFMLEQRALERYELDEGTLTFEALDRGGRDGAASRFRVVDSRGGSSPAEWCSGR